MSANKSAHQGRSPARKAEKAAARVLAPKIKRDSAGIVAASPRCIVLQDANGLFYPACPLSLRVLSQTRLARSHRRWLLSAPGEARLQGVAQVLGMGRRAPDGVSWDPPIRALDAELARQVSAAAVRPGGAPAPAAAGRRRPAEAAPASAQGASRAPARDLALVSALPCRFLRVRLSPRAPRRRVRPPPRRWPGQSGVPAR